MVYVCKKISGRMCAKLSLNKNYDFLRGQDGYRYSCILLFLILFHHQLAFPTHNYSNNAYKDINQTFCLHEDSILNLNVLQMDLFLLHIYLLRSITLNDNETYLFFGKNMRNFLVRSYHQCYKF